MHLIDSANNEIIRMKKHNKKGILFFCFYLKIATRYYFLCFSFKRNERTTMVLFYMKLVINYKINKILK